MKADVVLVRPENPANIGATARAMRNTGLHRLILVAPAPFRTVECWRSAWGAHDVLEAIEEVPDLRSAVERYDHLAAFTGRSNADQPATDVREIAIRFVGLPATARTAFVFGPETAGLSEDELRLCGVRVRIPTHPDQPSINLSHAVLVAGYEWLRASRSPPPGGDGLASGPEREAFLATWRDALVTAGALAEDDTRYFDRWADFIRRTPLAPRDLRLFVHLARKLKRP